ncbi:L-rhamnose-binding lectin CSL2-like protein [Labeo rohita]|uniref:L-rhamnose-binding lectin CSL2-like protein n=1 Tax=Labeo rohita TaxID=84645 RepID=A0A498MCZ3_LABRO|nr:L-rhamnose-binding lectin CSL2-like protein [Labeo rohita]
MRVPYAGIRVIYSVISPVLIALVCSGGTNLKSHLGCQQSLVHEGKGKQVYHDSAKAKRDHSHFAAVAVSTWCNEKKSCDLDASNWVFSDPCYRVHKYLEVTYSCV